MHAKLYPFLKEFGYILFVCFASGIIQYFWINFYPVSIVLLLCCFYFRDKNIQYLRKYVRRYRKYTSADIQKLNTKALTYGALAALIWILYVYIIYYTTGCDNKGCMEKYLYFRCWFPFLFAFALHISYVSLIIKRLLAKGIIC